MKSIDFGDRIQFKFWGNVDYASNQDAKAARDLMAKNERAQGKRIKKWSLTNQIRKYAGLGQPDGTMGTVFFLDVYKDSNE